MKIKFVVDSGEYLEGDVADLKDEVAKEHIEAGHAESLEKKDNKKEKKPVGKK